VKLTNLKITPKLGILVGVTLFGLCIAGALAGYLMQREMLNARIDQTKSIVDMALNMAAGLKKQVDAGQMTKEAALAEFGKRGNSMTYDKGAGYLFGTSYDVCRHRRLSRRSRRQDGADRVAARQASR
jgi:methyl-accepting chemotaxis protein